MKDNSNENLAADKLGIWTRNKRHRRLDSRNTRILKEQKCKEQLTPAAQLKPASHQKLKRFLE